MSEAITSLFLDVGGVLLTNGWDRGARARAAQTFHLDLDEMNERHHLTFDTYESGKLSLDDYLQRVIFYEERPFSKEAFRTFMFNQSQPYDDMLNLVRSLKTRYQLKVIAVSNEGRELTDYRIAQFKLAEIFDAFVASSYVHLRKPDLDIYRLALDISQTAPEQTAYLDDRLMFVQVAQSLGIRGIHHTDYQNTKNQLSALGLAV